MNPEFAKEKSPLEVLLSMEKDYWHQVKNAAAYLLAGEYPNSTELNTTAAGLIIGMSSGNYADGLRNFQGRMPSPDSEVLLAELIGHLETLETVGDQLKDHTRLVDETYFCYSGLVKCLRGDNCQSSPSERTNSPGN